MNKTMQSFIKVEKNSDFPIYNLPYCIFKSANNSKYRVGVGIGNYVLDLSVLEEAGLLKIKSNQAEVFAQNALNKFMRLGYDAWKDVRQQLTKLLDIKTDDLQSNSELCDRCFFKMSECQFKIPIEIGDYTDFFASEYHAINLGKMFRPNSDPLPVNWKHLPIGYHGRSSSIVISGTSIKRPSGQILNSNNEPVYSKSKMLDIEVELGFIVGVGNELGTSIKTSDAYKHIFGAVLVDDWSARDIQRWEYVPLGPFLGKSFATSVSPWVVSMFALEKFTANAVKQDVPIVEYLMQADRKSFDINFDVNLKTSNMSAYEKIANTNAKYLYWTYAQMVAHHTVNGCNLRSGDLLATGTISGPESNQYGSLIELTWNGFANNERRTFLEDQDSIKISAYSTNSEGLRIGFGSVEGTVYSE